MYYFILFFVIDSFVLHLIFCVLEPSKKGGFILQRIKQRQISSVSKERGGD